MSETLPFNRILCVLNRQPQAVAHVQGSAAHPALGGCVCFYQLPDGVLVAAKVTGLPQSMARSHGVFGFHIHSGSQCSGTQADPFADVLTHYNPKDADHPYHAGDLPPLFGNHGEAFQVFFTDRFSVCEILHKTMIIHAGSDDFTSQPAGAAGEKVACGIIESFR